MEGSFGDILVNLGLPGLVIGALGLAVRSLYNSNQELHKTLFEIGRDSVKANEATTAALNRMSDLLLRGRGSE